MEKRTATNVLRWWIVASAVLTVGSVGGMFVGWPVGFVSVITSPGAPTPPVVLEWDAAVRRLVILARCAEGGIASLSVSLPLFWLDERYRKHPGQGFPLG